MVRYIQYIKLMFYTPGPYLIMFILQDVFDNIFNVSIRVIVFFYVITAFGTVDFKRSKIK